MVQSVSFADLLKRYRVERGLTQEALAERARLSARTVSDLERGVKIRPYRDTLALLAEALALAAEERAALEAAARAAPARHTAAGPGAGQLGASLLKAATLDTSVLCPVLVGRAPYLQAMGLLLEQVCAGQGQTVLVAGEAGIGKSRLVAEALVAAGSRPARGGLPRLLVLQGLCFEPDRTLPYAPVLDLLRTFLGTCSPHEVARAAGPAAPDLVKLLPELATAFPGLAPAPTLDAEQEKRRLFHAVAGFFLRLAARQPLCVVVEDVHWSDDTGLDVLLYLARHFVAHPILLVLTYRTDEVHASLGHVLAELDRARLAAELVLTPLTAGEVDTMIRATLDLPRPIPLAFLETIVALTEGNPFFVEETLKSLLTAGAISRAGGAWDRVPAAGVHIPRSVQDAVQRRAAQVSPQARRVLALAAVAGRRFDFGLLQQVAGYAEDELLGAIKELIAAQLVVEESAERFAFRHALTRQAIYVQLLARERKALHRTIAETLQHLYGASPDAHLGDLAYHFYEAGAWEQALAYSSELGRQASALYAPRAAVEHLTRAVEAAGHLSTAPPPALYHLRGLAYETLGDFERALADHQTVLEAAGAAGDDQVEWQALLDLGMLWASRDYARAGAYYQRALAVVRGLGDPATLGHCLNRLGNWHAMAEQPLQGQLYHQEALAAFQELGDRHGVAETLDLLGLTSYVGCDLLQCCTYYEQAVAHFRDLGDRQGLASSLTSLAEASGVNYVTETAVSTTMPLAERVHVLEAALAVAREIGWRAQEGLALVTVAGFLGPAGEYAGALSAVHAGLATAEDIEHRQWMCYALCMLGALYLDLLAAPQAREHLARALDLAQAMNSPFWVCVATGFLASTHRLSGDHARAESMLDAALAPDVPAHTIEQRGIWCVRAELALDRGDAPGALRIVEQMVQSAPNVSAERIIPRLWKLRGEALALLQQGEEAEFVLRAAQDGAVAQGARPLLWRIHAALARLYAQQGRPADADRERAAARLIVEALAAGVADVPLRDRFLERATASVIMASVQVT
jgi:tetratricopeptide (TPR) repeat protein/transcriptional regulator with XRE-family HTH domain